MENEWIGPRIIIGAKVTGDYYYPRPQIVKEIWEEIKKGNNVLIAAPRRVGKTSVMTNMVENSPDGYKCIFENIQGIKSEVLFYERFYELLIKCLNTFGKTKMWFKEIWKEHKIDEITIEGKVKFKDGKIDYLEEINNLLPKLNSKEIKIVLFIDELPEVLHNLKKAGKIEEAASILENMRRWRQEDQFKNLRLVLAGSIGIHYVVKIIEGRTTDINDFNPIPFEALSLREANSYLTWATQNNATIQYNELLGKHLLSKIQYYVPYFINLMLDEINKAAQKNGNPIITTISIDEAFDKVVKNSDHFKDWKNRLFDYMPKDETDFLNKVLIHIAHKNKISKQKIHDIAVDHNKVIEMMDLIDELEKDGYITEQKENYIFLSPFLKAFWKRNNPIYNV
jgi:uncharacterized protein